MAAFLGRACKSEINIKSVKIWIFVFWQNFSYDRIMSALSILWGNQVSSPVNKTNYRNSFKVYQQVYGDILVPEQMHGIDGHVITPELAQNWHKKPLQGDYLITNEKNIWLGALTADCLPIIFYDPVQAVLAVAHAGWRGSVSGISQVVFNRLNQEFGVMPQDLQIFFGPGSGTCCYEVGLDFIDNLAHNKLAQSCIKQLEGRYFFDVLGYNMICLQNCNIPVKNFNLSGYVCTICNIEYCSYRRDNQKTGLQLSLGVLR